MEAGGAGDLDHRDDRRSPSTTADQSRIGPLSVVRARPLSLLRWAGGPVPAIRLIYRAGLVRIQLDSARGIPTIAER